MINVNDSPPKLSQDTYEAVLLLPTYIGVEVLRVEAFDPDIPSDLPLNPDKSITPQLVYSLVDNTVEYFSVGRYTGVVTVINQSLSKDRYRFNVKVSDAERRIRILCVELTLEIMISTGNVGHRVGGAVQAESTVIQCFDVEFFSRLTQGFLPQISGRLQV